MIITKEERYGCSVWINKEMDELRKKQCLCLNCLCIKTCAVAKQVYVLCKDNNLATMITRCPDFKQT